MQGPSFFPQVEPAGVEGSAPGEFEGAVDPCYALPLLRRQRMRPHSSQKKQSSSNHQKNPVSKMASMKHMLKSKAMTTMLLHPAILGDNYARP